MVKATRRQIVRTALADLAWHTRIYTLLIGAKIRSQMQYRFSFVADVFGNFASTAIDFAAIVVLFGRTRAIAGWSMVEVAVLYGLASTSFALAEMIGAGFDMFPDLIRLGQFDTLLIRPVSLFAQVMGNEFLLRRLGRLVQGAVILGVALHLYGMPPDLWRWAVLAGAVVCGVLVYLAIFMVAATSCFWTVESLEVFNILVYGGREMVCYPMDIYAAWMRRIFVFVMPLAFVSYLPVSLALGKTVGGTGLSGAWQRLAQGLPPVSWGWAAPVVGLGAMLVARKVWAWGVRHYQSTGS